jgi:hypothetical protein
MICARWTIATIEPFINHQQRSPRDRHALIQVQQEPAGASRRQQAVLPAASQFAVSVGFTFRSFGSFVPTGRVVGFTGHLSADGLSFSAAAAMSAWVQAISC